MSTQLVTQDAASTALDVYSKITDLTVFVNDMCESTAAMIGCDMRAGKAYTLMLARRNMDGMDFIQQYHMIQNRPVKRSDSMLTDFRMKFGGNHVCLENSPDVAAVRLIDKDGNQSEWRLTWEEALQEFWPWTKGHKPGDPPIPANLKDNWATPRGRMNMLWWRCVASALDRVCPEVVMGLSLDATDYAGDAEPAPAKAPPKKGFMETVAAAPTTTAVDPIAAADGDEQVEDAEFTPAVGVDVATGEVVTSSPDDPGTSTADQRRAIEELTAELFGSHALAAREDMLKKRSCQSLHNLSLNQASEIIVRLSSKQREVKKAAAGN